MIVTEQEAKTKWCQESPGASGRFTHMPEQKCIGSACMAWRRAPHHMQYDAGIKQDTTNGYCGKAGRP